MSKEAMKLALGKIKSARDCHPNAVNTLLFEAEEILEEALEKPDFWEGYVPEPVKPAPVQDNPLDCGVHLGSGKDHAIKHHVSYGPEPIDTLIAAWQALEETSGHVLDKGDVEGRMHMSVIRSAWEQMDSLVRDLWDERGCK